MTLFRNIAETMMFAAIGGLTFGLLGMPAGYLSGSIIVVAIAALAGRPMRVPTTMMRVLIVLIGISLGAVVTPETLRGLATYPLSVAVLLAATVAISVAGTVYLRWVHGWDKLTAYLGSVPGGMSQVMALAIEYKADVRAIAIVQTARIIILAVGLPALFAGLGLVDRVAAPARAAFDPSQIGELAILVAVSTAAAVIAFRINFPGGLLFGAMVTSAVLHGTDTLRVVMPWWLSYTVMIAFGAVTGSRFANTPLRLLLQYTGAAFGVFVVAVVVTAGFAGLLLGLLDIPAAEVMIAYAPGAADAMLLLALALGFDPVYVGTHHLVRIFFVMGAMPFLVRLRAGGSDKGPPVKRSADSSDD
ncbi:AbrB family transcriptional regulator [Undibacter mobilis]|uniref:AbrB family transcriptional regulator n=1 Tax=Undibacter mobilis TaxID=2292256 RepID=A0A371B866_9BRAD|nr:AbrB family transcriptional regulator [Undibacter mobilis]RDV03623.1 AbrB family transcriptional regulator [Undibacter mobilis]